MHTNGNGHAAGADSLAAIYNWASSAGSASDLDIRNQILDVRSSYFAGGESRYLPMPTGIDPMGTGADYHYSSEFSYFLMMERARADDRDNMVVGQAINRVVANILRTGMSLDFDTGDKAVDLELRARWKEWSSDPRQCDYEQQRTWNKIVQGCLRNMIVDGDVFQLLTGEGSVQTIEAHRCRNPWDKKGLTATGPTIVHGVERQSGRPVAFWLTDEEKIGLMPSRRFNSYRYDIFDRSLRVVCHAAMTKRLSQSRGVSALVPAVYATKYHDDLQFAALVNAKRSSFIAFVMEYEPGFPPKGKRQGGTRATDTRSDGTTRTLEDGTPGQVIQGREGEKITPWSANVPAPSFFEHSSLLLSILAVNLDLPPMSLMLDAKQGNFSSYRGVMDQAQLRYEQIQQELIDRLCDPVVDWQLTRWLAADRALARVAGRQDINIRGHRWVPQGWPYIQPVQDAAADDMRVSRNLTSARRIARKREGADWDDLVDEIVEDRAYLVRRSMEVATLIQREYPEFELDWRELAYGSLNLTPVVPVEEPEAPEPAGSESEEDEE